jgi:hypothetical protein
MSSFYCCDTGQSKLRKLLFNSSGGAIMPSVLFQLLAGPEAQHVDRPLQADTQPMCEKSTQQCLLKHSQPIVQCSAAVHTRRQLGSSANRNHWCSMVQGLH